MVRITLVTLVALFVAGCGPLDLVFAERSFGTVAEVTVENGVCSVTYEMEGRRFVSAPRHMLGKEICAGLKPDQTVPVYKKRAFTNYPDIHWDALS